MMEVFLADIVDLDFEVVGFAAYFGMNYLAAYMVVHLDKEDSGLAKLVGTDVFVQNLLMGMVNDGIFHCLLMLMGMVNGVVFELTAVMLILVLQTMVDKCAAQCYLDHEVHLHSH